MARILVIDDDEPTRAVICDMLAIGGHHTMEAADGSEGLRSFRRERPDLVITDIFMPEVTGLDVIRELRRDFPKAKIIATAAGGQSILRKAQDAGADKALEKPFSIRDFRDMVNALLATD